jgi:hypothetical protein
LAKPNFRKRTVSVREIDESEGQSHGLSVLDVVDGEVEITNKEYTIVFLEISTGQEVNISRNMKEMLLNVIRNF